MTKHNVPRPDLRRGRGVSPIVKDHVRPRFEKAEDAVGDCCRCAQRGIVARIAGVGEMNAGAAPAGARTRVQAAFAAAAESTAGKSRAGAFWIAEGFFVPMK